MPAKLRKRQPARTSQVKARKGQISFRARSTGRTVKFTAEGGENSLPRFEMEAYTGSRLLLAEFDLPVVIDLQGLSIKSQQRPMLRSHDHDRVVGHSTKIVASETNLVVSGIISGAGQDAVEVRDSGRNGFPWEASIGACAFWAHIEEVAEGEQVVVNGQTFEGPLYVARKSSLDEVSFVALGADEGGASAKVIGSAAGKGIPMTFEEWLASLGIDPNALTEDGRAKLQQTYNAEMQAAGEEDDIEAEGDTEEEVAAEGEEEEKPVAARRKGANVKAKGRQAKVKAKASGSSTFEQRRAKTTLTAGLNRVNRVYAANEKRINAIRQICGSKHASIAAKAIEENWSQEKTELAVMRAERPKGVSPHASGRGGYDSNTLIKAALCKTLKLPSVEKDFKPEVLEAADKKYRRGIGLQELCLEAAQANGYDGTRFRGYETAVMKAAFSTSELGDIFMDVANKFVREAFLHVDQSWRAIASIKPVTDFKTIHGIRLVDDLKFEKLGRGQKIKHGTLSDETYTNRAETHAKILTIDRQDLINDDMGALQAVTKLLGRGAALALNEVFWMAFNSNSNFFKTANGNILTGAGSAFSVDALTAAETLMNTRKHLKTKALLGITPKILLVPPAVETPARQLLNSSELRDTGADKKFGTANPHAGKYNKTPVMSPYLADTTLGGSTTAWYLLADPNDISTIEVVFLNGQEQPVIEQVELAPDSLGFGMRGYYDLGVALADHYAGMKNAGA